MTTRGPCEGRWGPGAARADVRSRGLLSRLVTAGLRACLPTAYLERGFLKFLPASLALPPSSSSILGRQEGKTESQISIQLNFFTQRS